MCPAHDKAGRPTLVSSRVIWPTGLTRTSALCSGALETLTVVQHLEPLRQDLFEIRQGTTLEEHVPVGSCGLDLLRLRQLTAHEQRWLAADLAVPRAWDLGLVGERDAESVVCGAGKLDDLTRCQLGVA